MPEVNKACRLRAFLILIRNISFPLLLCSDVFSIDCVADIYSVKKIKKTFIEMQRLRFMILSYRKGSRPRFGMVSPKGEILSSNPLKRKSIAFWRGAFSFIKTEKLSWKCRLTYFTGCDIFGTVSEKGSA